MTTGARWNTMPDSRGAASPVARPEMCPFCHSKAFDTLAKVITATTLWRCRACEGTWTIASQAATSPRER